MLEKLFEKGYLNMDKIIEDYASNETELTSLTLLKKLEEDTGRISLYEKFKNSRLFKFSIDDFNINAENLITVLTDGSGRTHFTTKETRDIAVIAFLEGRCRGDEMNEKIAEFKKGFVLSEEQWNGEKVDNDEEEIESD